ncbi:MAG: nickel-dependent hydrogenase large subunit [Rhodoferax sp.]|nr:nickel-dependent hydrogenase large subunit [Rhodoferax sp.]
MSDVQALTGSYALHPGAQPSITGHRPVLSPGLLGRLLRGREGVAAERMLGQLFSLCAHAHRHTAGLALQAATLPDNTLLRPEASSVLLLETARDHLRNMALDWPRRQAGLADPLVELGWLKACPLSLVPPHQEPTEDQAWYGLRQMRLWLEAGPLQQPVGDWLAQHVEAGAFADWCQSRSADFYPAQCLHHWYPQANTLIPTTRCLNLLSADSAQQAAHLRSMAHAMVTDTQLVQYPTWQGQCAETGPWARLRHGPGAHTAQTAWTRLSARWIELLEITLMGATAASPVSTPLLSCGALALGEHQAIAWCEMARGLLLHWLKLDASGRVLDYQVLAPTEWNFHPQGGLAQALTALGPHDTASARALAAAYDACVECSVTRVPVPPGSGHIFPMPGGPLQR